MNVNILSLQPVFSKTLRRRQCLLYRNVAQRRLRMARVRQAGGCKEAGPRKAEGLLGKGRLSRCVCVLKMAPLGISVTFLHSLACSVAQCTAWRIVRVGQSILPHPIETYMLMLLLRRLMSPLRRYASCGQHPALLDRIGRLAN